MSNAKEHQELMRQGRKGRVVQHRGKRGTAAACVMFFLSPFAECVNDGREDEGSTGRTTEQRLSFLFHAAGVGQIALPKSHIVQELSPALALLAESGMAVPVAGGGSGEPSHMLAVQLLGPSHVYTAGTRLLLSAGFMLQLTGPSTPCGDQ